MLTWIDFFAREYQTPVATLRRAWTPADLHHEIALVFATRIKEAATQLTRKGATKDERRALQKERARVRRSDDWFDRLVAERMAMG